MKQDTIYTTKQYNQFKFLPGNREINLLHVKRLVKEYDAVNGFPPIIINEKWEVLDGSHRLESCKQLNVPIKYRVQKGGDLSTVHTLNTNVRNWNTNDYLKSYISMGKKDYITFKQFLDSYGMGYDVTMRLLIGYGTDSGVYAKFKSGNFKIKNIEAAAKSAGYINEIFQHYPGAKRKTFIAAILKCLNKKEFDRDLFIKKVALNPSKLTDCARVDQYLLLIEEIYNYYNPKKISLRY